jgi:hypothetical protein
MANTASRKRRFEEDSLQIKLGSSADAAADPLVADRALLSAFSSCVRGLPAEATEWDISSLSIEGQAVERSTVVAWLNSIYQSVHGEDFEQQDPNPAHSMTGLAQLLLFADAVGSHKGLLLSLVPQAEVLHMPVKLGEQQLKLRAAYGYYFEPFGNGERSFFQAYHRQCLGVRLAEDVSTAQMEALKVQAAAQVEALLHIAYRMQLRPLRAMMCAFIKMNTCLVYSLLFGAMRSVLTERVLEAAAGDKELILQLMANHFSTEQGGMHPQNHAEQLLKPFCQSEEQREPLRFEAELTRDAFGHKSGDTVEVKLDLFGSSANKEPTITVNSTYTNVVQLLIGPVAWDANSMQLLLGPEASTEAS